ncbi:alpha/beta hydrolase [Microbacterium sp. LWH10-1.2]|uniref:alpha/beta fold hydrolase n=1 Tax=Microbacterium sp. LWH10-1.2 TaxID=3135255 RepID=UPI00313986A0
MKKSVKRVLVSVTAVAAVIAVGLATTTIVNVVATDAEQERIEPYGQLVEVDGRHMNVVISGKGDETIVLLPGFGTASPALDFAPLVDDLSADHRVVVVEPFGYGLSDGTDRERTTANIVSEVHEALDELDIDRYVLMGHSIAGVYGIELARRYPDEVQAFVGIDSSVPGQPRTDTAFPIGLLGAAKNLGLIRLVATSATGYEEDAYSEEVREQLVMLSNRNSLSATYLDEMSHIRTNFADALGTGFAPTLPLLLFVVEHNEEVPEWRELHEKQAASVEDGTVIALDGSHYLHHTQSPRIAEEFRAWEAARSAQVD